MAIQSWRDSDLDIKVYHSTSGDAIQYGTRTDYPFISGGPQGLPVGWVPWLWNAVDYSKVNVTTAYNRFSVSVRDPADVPVNHMWGMARRFPVKPGYRYQFNVQAQTMEGRSPGARYIEVYGYNVSGGALGTLLASKTVSESTWERIALGSDFLGATYSQIEIRLSMGWDNTVMAADADKNIGVQWQSLSITEQPPTPPVPTWQEITCDVQGITVRYGRERATNRFDVGTFSVTLLNDDGQYSFKDEPRNGFRPGRFIRATMTNAGSVEWPMFYGIIDSITDGYRHDGHAVTVINAFDNSTLLANTNVPTVSYTRNSRFTGAAARIQALLRSAGWFSNKQEIQAGTNFIQQPVFSNGRSIREECGVTSDSEGGLFFCDREGRITYWGRDYNLTRFTNVQAELLAMPYDGEPLEPVDPIPDWFNIPVICVNELVASWGRERIINDLDLANQGGSAYSFDDFESQSAYGVYSYQRMDFTNDNAYPQYLFDRANDIMGGYSQPVLRVNSVSFKPQPDDWLWIRYAFLNDLVRVRYVNAKNRWGYSVVTHVQGIEHRITVSDWETTVQLDDPEYFRWSDNVDSPGNGWDEAIWDVNIWDQDDRDIVPGQGAYWNSGQGWNREGTVWQGRGWSTGVSKWSDPNSDWKA